MTLPGDGHRFFHTSAELQEFLAAQPPGGLVIVPHMRLAQQVWRRQRLAARDAALAAWEPVALATLSGWWQQLWDRLWLPMRLASTLERLALWLEAMTAVPPVAAVTPDLSWAAALDEAFDLCLRYQLPPPADLEDSPLLSWRQAVTRQFADLMAERGLIAPAARLPYLLEALRQGSISLPDHLTVVGLEAPAPGEEQWLAAVARRIPVLQVHLAGRQGSEITISGAVLPDRRQEMEWVAAQVLELAHDRNLPLHRLAITGPNLETYLPDLRRFWRELLGPAAANAGGAYNISLGLPLADAPLFQAALLPLRFCLDGQDRRDLIAWLLSPYYGAFQPRRKTFLQWDRAWCQAGVASGWQEFQAVVAAAPAPDETIPLINRAISLVAAVPLPAELWPGQVQEIWRLLGFPAGLEPAESRQWQDLQDLVAEAAAAGKRPWTAAALLEWLTWGAGQVEQPGQGSTEAGIQIQGLLELRGLDFDAVFCLGLNMGNFPPPPRDLPLLSPQEKGRVLGGDYDSQRQFAETSYRYLLASVPNLFLTRPRVEQDEERLASPVIPPDIWMPKEFAALSQPHPAWARSPAVSAALWPPPVAAPAQDGGIILGLPEVISLSALETALACPCRFYLGVLLGLEELPDVEPGLTPRDRGSGIHELVHRFTSTFGQILELTGAWDDAAAWQHLLNVAAGYRSRSEADLFWEAEIARWLEGEEAILTQWLGLEKTRFQEGWRWLATEDSFTGLEIPDWPTKIKGRLDRVDVHQIHGLMLWDYKTGVSPPKNDLIQERSRFQLLGYLLAVQQGLTAAPPHPEARAGIICLKSSRQDHLKFEDYELTAAGWQEILAAKLPEVARVGRRVGEGDFRPEPCQPPPARNHSCQFCPFSLLCGYRPEAVGEIDI